ncbi:hypothetical protein [Lysobacter sp. Hz 25]|uniref:DUF7674 family protein n=1 Tax=Lysobacter sp. Hz 25 TaxID=3383698 RepID=UPI0038D4634F
MDSTSQAPREDLLASFFRIFPGFQDHWHLDREDEEWPSTSLHSVYLSFLPYVSAANPSQKQLKHLAVLVDRAVSMGGDSENAVSTCFLEHLGQTGLLRALRPLLNPEARSRLMA